MENISMNIFPQKHLPHIWNTKESGVIEFVIYLEEGRYIGVCLTFDIVEENTDISILKKSMEEAAFLHLKVVREKNLSDQLLNRPATEEYWDKYYEIKDAIERKNAEEIRNIQGAETSAQIYPAASLAV